MKKQSLYWKMSASLAAAVLTLFGSSSAPAALTGSLTLRPLTPTEIKSYSLTNPPAQSSAGLTTVGLGEPAYLEALVNIRSNNTSVVWTLVSKPGGSAATLLPSPFGTNVPVYKPMDKTLYRAADRMLLRPDVVGFYTVNAAITTVGSGSTNVSITICGATYLGIGACAACHSGNFANVPNVYASYTNTPHATAFARAVDGISTDHFGKNCISCHVVGYDTNSFANNGGFDDVAAVLGWTLPTVYTNGNWANMPEQLKDVSNIQCESCHGPGSQHMFSQGRTGNTNATSVTYAAAACNKCHDSTTRHYRTAEWNFSGHAVAPTSPSGAGRQACVRCHTAGGFIGYVNNLGSATPYATNLVYEAITCQTCHNPHDYSNPAQLRTSTVVPLVDGTVVTNAGTGGFCFHCHTAGRGSYASQIVNYPLLQPTWNGGTAFGVHDSPQADMLEGVNAETYGKAIPNSPHANVVADTCVGCHMQPVESTSPAFLKAGGHTTKMTYLNASGAVVPLTTVCTKCHGEIEDFDMPVADYNGDGRIDGIQTEVQSLLNKLSTLLPGTAYRADGNYRADGLVKAIDRNAIKTNWPAKFLKAGYNWQFVNYDGSLGVHNAAFAVGLLKASIGDLTGDANNDGLQDSWQAQYWGSNFATNPAAAYNATNSTGMPNWLVASLGLSPLGSFKVSGNSGVVYFNGNNVVNGDTNTIAIYTAAEIAFNTQVGTSYQIQGVSSLSGGWQNVSTNIPGTGASVSYVTPTRGNAQMFYRVVSQ